MLYLGRVRQERNKLKLHNHQPEISSKNVGKKKKPTC